MKAKKFPTALVEKSCLAIGTNGYPTLVQLARDYEINLVMSGNSLREDSYDKARCDVLITKSVKHANLALKKNLEVILFNIYLDKNDVDPRITVIENWEQVLTQIGRYMENLTYTMM